MPAARGPQEAPRAARALEALTGRVGDAAAWLTLAMVLLSAGNALARYAGRFLGRNLSPNTLVEAQWYLFAAVFLLGAASTLRDDAHVRVDVVYGRLRARTRAALDLAGHLVFLLPFCAFALWACWPAVAESIRIHEGSPDPGGLPRWPIKALVPVAFALLGLQGVASAIRAFTSLRVPDADR